MKHDSMAMVLVFAGVLLFSMSGVAHANIGIPMIVVTLPGMAAALLPVTALEASVLRKRVQLTWKRAVAVSGVANLVTTLVGIPLSWAILFGIELLFNIPTKHVLETPLDALVAVTIQAPWMYKYYLHWKWMIPAAAVWLLIPFFFMSWWMEYRVAARMLKDTDRAKVKAAMLRGNLISYGLLECATIAWLIYEVTTGTFVAVQ